MSSKNVITIDGDIRFPRGFTISDNRIEDELQQLLSSSAYCVWRQYLRFWGSDKKKAYPSLAYLSRVTGMAERTIRKSNKELVDKKFLRKNSGNSSKSNSYFYIPIDDIIKHHAKEIVVDEPEQEKTPAPVREDPINKKVEDILRKVPETLNWMIIMFVAIYNGKYKEKFGAAYTLDENDAQTLLDNVAEIARDSEKYESLVNFYFKTKNKFIVESDYSIYLFWRPKVMRVLLSEYMNTDEGRWETQAEKIWQDLKIPKAELADRQHGLESFFESRVKFSGANMGRDRFVLRYLVNKTKKLLQL